MNAERAALQGDPTPASEPRATVALAAHVEATAGVRHLAYACIDGNQYPKWCTTALSTQQLASANPLFVWQKLVMATRCLGSSAKLVAFVLANRCTKEQTMTWPSISTLQRDTSLSRNAVIAAIRAMEQRQFIYVQRGQLDPEGDPRTNLYHLTWPLHDDVPAGSAISEPPSSGSAVRELPLVPPANLGGATAEPPGSALIAPEVARVKKSVKQSKEDPVGGTPTRRHDTNRSAIGKREARCPECGNPLVELGEDVVCYLGRGCNYQRNRIAV